MSNSDIILVTGVHMLVDNTVPCDQHVWQFKSTSLKSLFKHDIKNEINRQCTIFRQKTQHTDIDWLCTVVHVTCEILGNMLGNNDLRKLIH